MNCYALKASKYDWRTLEPITNTAFSEEYVADHNDLYLTTEHTRDQYNNVHRYYRLHVNTPHNIEMALAYDIQCPCCKSRMLKQVGRCQDYHTLGLYQCPVCDKK